jgi:hypothetical protein
LRHVRGRDLSLSLENCPDKEQMILYKLTVQAFRALDEGKQLPKISKKSNKQSSNLQEINDLMNRTFLMDLTLMSATDENKSKAAVNKSTSPNLPSLGGSFEVITSYCIIVLKSFV